MAAETDALSASVRPVVRRADRRLSPWLVAPLVLAAAGGSGYLGARWGGDALSAELALVLVLGTGAYLIERFRVGYDDQDHQCLPSHRWYLIDRHDRDVTRGGIVAFAALGLGPYFRDGQTLVKRVAGMPGDHVEVGPETVRINGAAVGDGLSLAGALKRPPTDFLRDDTVPPGHLWMMGATADSFDSRYWGFLPERQVTGQAYALW